MAAGGAEGANQLNQSFNFIDDWWVWLSGRARLVGLVFSFLWVMGGATRQCSAKEREQTKTNHSIHNERSRANEQFKKAMNGKNCWMNCECCLLCWAGHQGNSVAAASQSKAHQFILHEDWIVGGAAERLSFLPPIKFIWLVGYGPEAPLPHNHSAAKKLPFFSATACLPLLLFFKRETSGGVGWFIKEEWDEIEEKEERLVVFGKVD